MKKPTTKAASAETPAAKPAETPLTDSWQASIKQGATPGIFPIMSSGCFAVGHGTVCKFIRGLQVMHYPDSKVESNGQRYQWALEGVDWAEDGETLLRIWEKTWFETKKQADAALTQKAGQLREQAKKALAAQAAEDARKQSPNEEDLTKARLTAMREQYPDTFEAMDKLAAVEPGARPEAVESLFRAYAVDLVRLHKPANLGDVSPFKSLPADMTLLMGIAQAYRAQSPLDPVDVEIAARWFAAGYDKMSLTDYTRAINAVTGAKLKPDAMKKRRLKKLGLLSARPEGRPEGRPPTS